MNPTLLLLLQLSLTGGVEAREPNPDGATAGRPNVVLILADDPHFHQIRFASSSLMNPS
jgi:hypothetical protein